MIQASTELSLSNELIAVISLLYCVAFIILLVICVCGCRKSSPKDDFLGVDGMVKINNPDENVNHLPSVGKYISQNKDDYVSAEIDDFKRPSGGSNPHRSLPDIPVCAEGDVVCSDNGVSADTSSDLYATVEDKIGNVTRHSLPNGLRSHVPTNSSPRQQDNYARVRENPYDQVKKGENAYAAVQGCEEATSSANAVAETADEADMSAAGAVAGRVAASQELPYMTPPVSLAGDEPPPTVAVATPSAPQQQHFSGDSQDSSKGYTSISVREPLEHIRRDTVPRIDPHYATVSDDSDDNMYAAIAEPPQDTYAQIHPPVTVVQVHETDEPVAVSPVPVPPVTTRHSRQASSSSCTSSLGVGSPKPEKRQANSPLPPTPPTASPTNLDDMYAKVQKPQRRAQQQINRLSWPHDPPVSLEHCYETLEKNKKLSPRKSDVSDIGYEKIRQNEAGYEQIQKRTHLLSESSEKDSCASNDPGYERLAPSDIDPNYEILRPNNKIEPGYSVVNKKKRNEQHDIISEPNYESILNNIQPIDASESNFEPNYESVQTIISKKKETETIDPGYERLDNIDPNYECVPSLVNKMKKMDSSECSYEPNYESVSSIKKKSTRNDAVSSGYERLDDNDPNYESVPPITSEIKVSDATQVCFDPNYESVPASDGDNYATVKQRSTESESDPNYESVKYLDVTLNEPPYERLNNHSDPSDYEQLSSDGLSAPGYERINHSDNSEDRTISDTSKISSGTDDEDTKHNQQCGSSSLQIDTVSVEEIIKTNTDEHMYFQV